MKTRGEPSFLPAGRANSGDFAAVVGPRGWAERHGAWILSLCFHVILFATLGSRSSLPSLGPVVDVPESIQKIDVRLISPPPPKPAPTPMPPRQVTEPPAAASMSRSESQEAAAPAEQSLEPLESEIAEAEEHERRVREILERFPARASGEQRSINRRRSRIKERLRNAELRVAAAPHFPDYKGARVGPVRILDLTKDVDPHVAKQVMNRYNIRVYKAFVDETGPSFLSSAATGGTVYRQSNKAGYFEVMEISPKANTRMMWLEQQWLVSHGYEPRTTRIDTVEFGIVEREPGFWDLGIIRMEVQELAQVGKPTIGATTKEWEADSER